MKNSDFSILGWDIGGVNIKAVRLDHRSREDNLIRAVVRPFEIWRDLDKLTETLRDIGKELGWQPPQSQAVTMTAELSDVFRTKREGVIYVLDAVEQAFENSPIHAFGLEGRFLNPQEARQTPLLCAAANWLASALFVAAHYSDCVLMDVGSTTTDIIPIREGKAITRGRTDTDRLIAGELVYTGVLRTNPNTIANRIPVKGRPCRVAAEYFTAMADVYLILGQLTPDEYKCTTADGQAKTIPAARDRLARLVCSDGEIMSQGDIYSCARFLQEKQLQQLVDALFQVLSGVPNGFDLPLVLVGSGAFLAGESARRLGLEVIDLEREWDAKTLAAFPAMAAAWLLARESEGGGE